MRKGKYIIMKNGPKARIRFIPLKDLEDKIVISNDEYATFREARAALMRHYRYKIKSYRDELEIARKITREEILNNI